MAAMETLVSPAFLTPLAKWLVGTKPKLEKFCMDYGESLTSHRICTLDTNSPMVKLEVAVQMYDAEQLSRFKLTDNKSICLTYR